MIVDAQVHIWGACTPGRPWPPGGAHTAHRAEPWTAREVLRAMDGAGVGRAVLVPPSWEGDRNDLVLSAVARHPDRFLAMGRLPLHDRAATARRVAGWPVRAGMPGVRLTFHREPLREEFARGGLDWLWPLLADRGLPVMLYAPGLTGAVGRVARRHPGLTLILDHLALPVDRVGAAAFDGLAGTLDLARHPRVAVKVSALPCHTERPYPFTDLHPWIRRVREAFGPERMAWGSDLTRLPCAYRECVELFTRELPFLDDADRAMVMGGTLLSLLAVD
ncbi:amidohydrolase family protein [Streptomyces sp. SP18CS02]|uniref:amidohydrolase family protein n=1 Tax=Streptomyces sp. SP18CS02 TaxID=3002531 RepID=UPI002E7A3556|nr:amidohydrolase family protein [Streptomyces sp. SP18CS02]MEE1756443.1 amidohydrolase family protein [Streptomyces sp. SP18CS02]